MKLISIENIGVNLSNKNIISGITFNINEGEYFSIIGPNGAGKSTLLKAMCNIIDHSSGDIIISGTNIRSIKQKELAKQITYVSQIPVINNYSVYDFIMFSRYPYFSSFSSISSEDKKKVQESMEITDIVEFTNRKLRTLSGGERQRVNIASAIAQDTKIILFDEPGTFLDPFYDQQISELISNINKNLGITVVNVTHNINKALLYSDRIAALKNGKLEFLENTYELRTEQITDLYDTEFIDIQHPISKNRMIIKK
ncbi:MAG: ABC transporter ATP-binding protein [Candidatus Delongbacteria bacterium]|nr:ABC transporter ATP-binding protein [Candidatus Delongbacteria bacterium]